MTTKSLRSPGRPRRFDPEQAVATAQRLFHAHGYDAVNVAHVTEALSINPPSFYAAFGSKGGLYSRVLDRYACTDAIPLEDLLLSDRPVAECLVSVLEDAARRYASDPGVAGCLVLEGIRSIDPEARKAASAFHSAAEGRLRDYIAARHPECAERLTDFISTTLSGLSAKARYGCSQGRLLATARLAGLVVVHEISGK
ncbi:TetR/AcrR family transcriptional regulator [Pantoea sp. BAV 3049]|uniref:TetR/AcrR family transcriptional regulator n=1 Tax=Pantoea sp. BAV 3049 TaxID=2654188 RepID=UPI00131C48D9|nr:TetR/AcrR family transcriptional regulator [Pantoea sp. BAV 3049]